MTLPSELQDGYAHRRPGTPNALDVPCSPSTTMPPLVSTAMRVPSGEKAGFRDPSGSSSVTRRWVKSASTTRNTSLRPRLNAEKSTEPPSGDQVAAEFGCSEET